MPIVWQGKKGLAPSPWKALKEAEEAAGAARHGIAAVHRDAKNPGDKAERLVIMSPRTFALIARYVDWTDFVTATERWESGESWADK